MKFINLLKKELRELLSFQTIVGMFVSVAILFGLGSIMGGVMDDVMSSSEINVCDQDNTAFTQSILSSVENNGDKINHVEVTTENRSELMKKIGADSLVIIPKGFTTSVLTDKKPAQLELISVMKNTSMSGSISSTKSSSVVEIIQKAASETLLSETYGFSAGDIAVIKEPVSVKEVTVVGDRSADVSSALISSFTMMQGVIVPIVIFILVMFASQMIISAISTEKIDKTLETLLSAPVSRVSVLTAKMLAATIVALLNAAVYMLGFSKYMGGITGSVTGSINSETAGMASALSSLGLQMQPVHYLFLGLQMFMTIMIALAVSLILGAMATDAKSAQTLIMPIMFCAMIPYMLSMFTSINSLPTVLKIIIYAIPFTHTFTAVDNLLFGNMTLFWGGFVYQVVLFAVVMFLAVRLFTSDKIFTISLNLGQKFKARKNLSLFSKK